MDELIQTYIPSTVETCIDVGDDFGCYTNSWTLRYPYGGMIEWVDDITIAYRYKVCGLGAICKTHDTTSETLSMFLSNPNIPSPALVVLKGAKNTVQNELSYVSSVAGTYVIIWNPVDVLVPSNLNVLYESSDVLITVVT